MMCKQAKCFSNTRVTVMNADEVLIDSSRSSELKHARLLGCDANDADQARARIIARGRELAGILTCKSFSAI